MEIAGTVFKSANIIKIEIAPGINRCEVLSYGISVKALMRGWGIYPLMLDAVCEPYNDRGQAISLPSDAG